MIFLVFSRVSNFIEDLTTSSQDGEKIRKTSRENVVDKPDEPSKIKNETTVIIPTSIESSF